MTTHLQRRAACLLAGAIAGSVFGAGETRASESSGCAAAGAGALNAEVAPAGTATRQATLDAGDVLDFTALSNAAVSVSLISGSGAPQSLLSGSSTATASFRVPAAGAYTFGIAAGPGASAQVRVTCVSAQTAAANAAFLARRKDIINAKDPDRIRIDRTPTAIANPDKPLASSVAVDEQGNAKEIEFSVSLSEIEAAANPGRKPSPGFVDLWLEGRMRNYAVGSSDNGNLGVVYLGTRTKLGPDILVGGLAQFDRGVESATYGESQMAASGWMVGPYMSMKLGSGVVFDSRVAWGETENVVPGLALSDSETDRRLLRAKLTGTRQVEGWNVAPSLKFVYLEDAVRDGDSGETRAQGTGRVRIVAGGLTALQRQCRHIRRAASSRRRFRRL